jgi:hypothetical protein
VPAIGSKAHISPGQQGCVRVHTSLRQPKLLAAPPLIFCRSVLLNGLPAFLSCVIHRGSFMHQKLPKTLVYKFSNGLAAFNCTFLNKTRKYINQVHIHDAAQQYNILLVN